MREHGDGAAPNGKDKGKQKAARDPGGDSEDDSDGGGAGGAKEKDTTDKRRRKALEGSSKAAAVKPSRQVNTPAVWWGTHLLCHSYGRAVILSL